MSGELPPGWERAALGDVTIPKVDQVAPHGSTFEYIDISAIDRDTKRIGSATEIPTAHAPSRARQRVRANDVLVSMTRPNLNAVALVPQDLDAATASTGFDVLRAIGVLPEWLFAHVRTPAFVQEMSQLVQGALYPAVNSKDVRASVVPIPPLNEQKRIVAKLDALQARHDNAKQALDAIPPLLDKLRQAILRAAFRGDLTREWRARNPDVEPASVLLERIRAERRRRWEEANPRKKYVEPEPVDPSDLPELPEGWCWASLDQLAFSIRNGISERPSEDAGVPILRISAVRPLRLDTEDIRFLAGPIERFSQYLLRENDLLFTRYNGNADLVGACAVVERTDPRVYPDKLIRVRVVPSLVCSHFVAAAIHTGSSIEHIRSHTKTAAGQVGISGADLKMTPVPLAPQFEQGKIAHLTQAFLAIAQACGESHDSALQQCVQLWRTILAKAFRGELVPQDPNDEPASVLLERIRAERAAADGEAGGKKKRGRSKE